MLTSRTCPPWRLRRCPGHQYAAGPDPHQPEPDGAGLAVVGDDAQSIYSFRAATVENILNFPAAFGSATTVTLERNYRSTQPILDAANALIGEATRQHRKVLQAERGGGERPALISVQDLRQQAEHVVARILANREAGLLLRRQAVLFRSSHDSDLLEIELTRHDIPFVKYGGLKFLEAAHVKDLLSILRWADNPRNEIAAFRVLQLMDGVGPANARRSLDALARAGFEMRTLREVEIPTAAAVQWNALADLLESLGNPAAPWTGQTRRAREWYTPLLEQHYDRQRCGPQISSNSSNFPRNPSRERFLTELALDPPEASGDHTGPPLMDEDYLILSPCIRPRARNGMRCTCSMSPTEASRRNSRAASQSRSKRSGGFCTSRLRARVRSSS